MIVRILCNAIRNVLDQIDPPRPPQTVQNHYYVGAISPEEAAKAVGLFAASRRRLGFGR